MKKTRRALRALRRRLTERLRQRREQERKFKETGKKGHFKEVKKDTGRIHHLKRLVAKMLRREKAIEASHREGIDWAYGDISPKALKKAGKDFIIRYVSRDPGKALNYAEAKKFSRAGIDLAVVFEDSSGAARNGYDQGRTDALFAHKMAEHCGMPKGRPVYLAVDFDAAAEGVDVRPYFRGAAHAVGKERVGIYAGLNTLQQVADEEIVGFYWQTYAWSHHVWDHRAHIRQVLIDLPGNRLILDGVPVDYDKSRKADFGQWKVSGTGK